MKLNKSFNIKNTSFLGDKKIHGKISEINGNKSQVINNFITLYKSIPPFFICRVSINKNGEYSFDNIDLKKGPFFIVSHDPTGENSAVIADNIGGPNYVDN